MQNVFQAKEPFFFVLHQRPHVCVFKSTNDKGKTTQVVGYILVSPIKIMQTQFTNNQKCKDH